MNLTKDIYQVLVEYMGLMDIANLSKANPRLGKWLYPLFLKRLVYLIDYRIRKHFECYQRIQLLNRENVGTYDNFVLAMIESKALIGGSCILQIIRGEYYGTGINIYVSDSINANYLGPILRCNHLHANPYRWEYKTSRKIVDIDEYAIHVPTGPLAEHFHRFKIVTIDTDPEYYIRNYLDFNILKNWFYYDDNKKPHIEITALNDILNSRITIDKKKSEDYALYPMKKLEKLEKYKKLGFTFISNISNEIFMCPTCYQKYKTAKTLRSHRLEKHNIY